MGNPIIVTAIVFILLSACTGSSSESAIQETVMSDSGTTEFQTPANILLVRAEEREDGTWTFYVTIEHEDTGWEDYADGWDVLLEDGTVLKPDPESPFTRLLAHPHVDEQPFIRSQNNIRVPPGVSIIRVRAHELVEGYSGNEVVIDFSVSEGENYQIVNYAE